MSPSALVPPSSNPADLYKAMSDEVRRKERHSPRIDKHRAVWQALSVTWEADGSIDSATLEEIVFLLNDGEIDIWRPLIYLIPKVAVEARLQPVPPSERAGIGPEYIIEVLDGAEFDAIELNV